MYFFSIECKRQRLEEIVKIPVYSITRRAIHSDSLKLQTSINGKTVCVLWTVKWTIIIKSSVLSCLGLQAVVTSTIQERTRSQRGNDEL